MSNKIQEVFIHNLKEIRFSKELSQSDLAKLIGVSSVTISNYESGRTFPKPAILDIMIVELDIRLEDLLISNK